MVLGWYTALLLQLAGTWLAHRTATALHDDTLRGGRQGRTERGTVGTVDTGQRALDNKNNNI